MEILRGHIYRAKRPKPTVTGDFNDRMVLYINPLSGRIQYDSPTVRSGWKYPTVDHAQFEAWAGSDVTEGYPNGDWATWPSA